MSQYKAEVFCVDITQTITPSASLDTHSLTHFKTSRSRLSHTIQATISASTPIHTIDLMHQRNVVEVIFRILSCIFRFCIYLWHRCRWV